MLLQPHQRRWLSNFELIDYTDAQAQALRAQLDISAPIELHWQWDYAGNLEELRNLYEKGKVSQWNAEVDLDWQTPMPADEFAVKPEESLMAGLLGFMGADRETQIKGQREELCWLLSQLLHGEQAALQLCAQLVNVCPDMDQKFYAGSQVIDEVRHCETFAKLLQRKLGRIYPLDANLKYLLDRLLTVAPWYLKCVGMQLLFESVALGSIDQLREAATNPLLEHAVYRISQDESRHAAFGVLSLRRVLPALSAQERNEVEDFAFEILECFHRGQMLGELRALLPDYGLDPDNVVVALLAEPTFSEKRNLIYKHTMANLRNLGLITQRTRAGYAELGLV